LYVISQPLNVTTLEGIEKMRRCITRIGPALVVVDSLIRALPGVDENSASEVNLAMTAVNALRQEMGFALLLIHHATKAQGEDLQLLPGTRDFAAQCDIAFILRHGDTAEEESAAGLFKGKWAKSRWASADEPPLYFRLADDEQGHPSLTTSEAPNAKQDVLDLLSMQSPLTRGQILSELKGVKGVRMIEYALTHLVSEGQIARVGRGVYGLPATTKEDA
jgi:hypothetical protein